MRRLLFLCVLVAGCQRAPERLAVCGEVFELDEHSQARRLALVSVMVFDVEKMGPVMRKDWELAQAELVKLRAGAVSDNPWGYCGRCDVIEGGVEFLDRIMDASGAVDTDADGRFTLNLPAGRSWVIVAIEPNSGYWRGWVAPVGGRGTVALSFNDSNLVEYPGKILRQMVMK